MLKEKLLQADLKAVEVLRSKTPKENLRFSSGGIAQLARAVALQAIGQGFESLYLQIRGGMCFSFCWTPLLRISFLGETL